MSMRIVVIFAFLFTTSLGFVVEPKRHSNARIVGGKEAVQGQFPWMISLRHRERGHLCGGSILNSKWILTAAHCALAIDATEHFAVVAGSISLSSGGIVYDISRVIHHENFNLSAVKNDVAVIELKEEIEFTEFVQSIEISSDYVDEVESVLSGWGRLSLFGPVPDKLQYMNVSTITLGECRQMPTILTISDDEICTPSVFFYQGACHGDSGGPLVAGGKQIGIVSWGSLPCAFGNVDVYTRVSSFVKWINRAIST